jgi:maltooligosyltrehalose trehalohydrolase
MPSSSLSIPFGAEVLDEGVRFSLWAPSARRVDIIIDDAPPQDMPDLGEGRREIVSSNARAGSRYSFRIDGRLLVPDPASRFQPDGVTNPSLVIDPRSFAWTDQNWNGRPWIEAVVWEAHVGTATPEGTYAALAEKLPTLKDLGITAIELMPLADCPGNRNWGYDGVLPFAPNSAYGTPDDLRRFVDNAHSHGIMIFVDVVYNHFGPSGNFLNAYARNFFNEAHRTPWGGAINFDADGRDFVREFFVQNALYWLDEFHMDGIRFDAVHALVDDSDQHVLQELAVRIRESSGDRHIHLILENEHNSAHWLQRSGGGHPPYYTAQWNDDIHHCWHCLLTGESEGYYEDFSSDPLRLLGRCLAEGFAYQGDASPHQGGKQRGEISAHLPPQAFVSFLQNHDQIGNRALGERLSMLAPPERLDLAHAIFLLTPQIPMLFMGEEWNASSPFLFFVDFSDDPELSRAVRDGRRREFSRFAAFNDPKKSERIPDPTTLATFEKSKLNWAEAASGAGAKKRAMMRDLLHLRAEQIVPLLAQGRPKASYVLPEPELLQVTWDFPSNRLFLAFNTGSTPQTFPAPEGLGTLWKSQNVATNRAIELPAWSAILMKGPLA